MLLFILPSSDYFLKLLPQIERLDLQTGPAPLAPELAYKEDLHGKERSNQLKQAKAKGGLEEDVVHNDFKREMLFYRQAQAAVLESLPRSDPSYAASKLLLPTSSFQTPRF